MSETPVIILTGAGRGIGYAILKYLLALPNPPNILATSRNISTIEPLAKEHENLKVVSVDFAAPSADLQSIIPDSIIQAAVAKWGRIDSLLLNHGVLDPILKIDVANLLDWETNYRVNFFSNVALVKWALPELRKTGGRVVMVSSGASQLYFTGWGAYGSSKAAINHFGATLAHEEPSITAISIAPGIVDTDMQKSLRGVHGAVMSDGENTFFTGIKESGGLVQPETVGAVLANLALKADKSLSGKYLNWDDDSLSSYASKA